MMETSVLGVSRSNLLRSTSKEPNVQYPLWSTITAPALSEGALSPIGVLQQRASKGQL